MFRFPAGGEEVCLFSKSVQIGSGSFPSPGDKSSLCEVHLSFPRNARLRMIGVVRTSTVHTSLLGVLGQMYFESQL